MSDFEYILDYSGFIGDEKTEYIKEFTAYAKTFTTFRHDKAVDNLRKQINNEYYVIYKKCFFRAVNDRNLPDTIKLFLNFGYMDGAFLSDDMIDGIYDISCRPELTGSANVFTIFNWLKAVYRGDREPSKNEFDLDFEGYLKEEYKNGNIKEDDIDRLLKNPEERAGFEIDNMFKTVNRLTYGAISSFNAIMSDMDMETDPMKLLVTARKLQTAFNRIKSIDFSAYYRPLYSYPLQGNLSHEIIVKEILPDVILMPNVGTKCMMWQETASVANDTPARFMLPMFTLADVDDLIIELTARYRWEICRKIQGARWNDIREHSLTSDYYDYLQFYRKNHELSNEAKDKIKESLIRAQKNYREVFVEDYYNWIKYESIGGFRLNKYVRKIIFTYCPFSKAIREKLNDNPSFTDVIHQHEVNAAKVYKRIKSMYDIYEKNGGTITEELRDNLEYYEM